VKASVDAGPERTPILHLRCSCLSFNISKTVSTALVSQKTIL
jgi:hypothetical protein